MIKKLLILIACMALMSGCTKSNMVNATEAQTEVGKPDFETKDNVTIDWPQVSDDAEAVFDNKNDYPYSVSFSFRLEPNKKEIMLVWVVSDDLPDDEIEHYMNDLVKGFNDVVATQDFSIARSSETSYGGLWKRYGLYFGIAPVSTQDDPNTWFVSGNYPAGSNFVLPDVNAAMEKAKQEQSAGQDESTGQEKGLDQQKSSGQEKGAEQKQSTEQQGTEQQSTEASK